MYTIENGLGPKWRWLAVFLHVYNHLFLFHRNAIQSNTLTQQLYSQLASIFGTDNFLMSTTDVALLGDISSISIMHVAIGLVCASIVGQLF